jgi:hypothetical protein
VRTRDALTLRPSSHRPASSRPTGRWRPRPTVPSSRPYTGRWDGTMRMGRGDQPDDAPQRGRCAATDRRVQPGRVGRGRLAFVNDDSHKQARPTPRVRVTPSIATTVGASRARDARSARLSRGARSSGRCERTWSRFAAWAGHVACCAALFASCVVPARLRRPTSTSCSRRRRCVRDTSPSREERTPWHGFSKTGRRKAVFSRVQHVNPKAWLSARRAADAREPQRRRGVGVYAARPGFGRVFRGRGDPTPHLRPPYPRPEVNAE